MSVRLIQILRLLKKSPMDAEEIASTFGFSPITARRHVQRLRDRGYDIQIDKNGRYFVLGQGKYVKGDKMKLTFAEKTEALETDMERAAYRYVLETQVSGVVATRKEDGEVVWRCNPLGVAKALGIDDQTAQRVLDRLESKRYLCRYGGTNGPVYSPCEDRLYSALIKGQIELDEKELGNLLSKKKLVWPVGETLLSVASQHETELPDGKLEIELHSNTGLSLTKNITEGLICDALSAMSVTMDDWMVELPDTDTENEIQPENNLLMRFLTEFNAFNPWPWLWLMDLKRDMPEDEWKAARSLFWSRALRLMLILLEPLHQPLCKYGVKGCTERTEERMKKDDALKHRLQIIGAQRFWELSRAVCIELLGDCIKICETISVDQGVPEAKKILVTLSRQRK